MQTLIEPEDNRKYICVDCNAEFPLKDAIHIREGSFVDGEVYSVDQCPYCMSENLIPSSPIAY